MNKRKREVRQALTEAGVPNLKLAKVIGTLKKLDVSAEELSHLDDRWAFDRASGHLWTSLGDEAAIRLELTEQHFEKYQFDWLLGNVPKLLAYHCETYPGFRHMLTRTFLKQPCTPDAPWRYVLNFDEYVPGNVLHPENSRKA